MRIYAISDLHLSGACDKPMDVFGENWNGHWEKIKDDWQSKVEDGDTVLIAGDVSWAMGLDDALVDLKEIASLKGNKFIIRGNHDYWWSSYKKINSAAPASITFIQNNAFKAGEYIICGTRGWTVPENKGNDCPGDIKLYEREQLRLKLTLDAAAAMRKSEEKIIVMMHYPPFNANFEDSAFTALIESYNADTVIYGHLHGTRSRYQMQMQKGGTNYLLTSCDLLNNRLIQIY